MSKQRGVRDKLIALLRGFFLKPEYVFVVPALIFGLLSAILMPQLIVNDENMHFIRSYQLTELEVAHNCTIPSDIKERGFFAMYSDDTPDYSFDTKKVDMSDQMNTDCGTATTYNPLLHAPQAIGVTIAKVVSPTTGAMVLFGRIANVLMYAAVLFFIIRNIRVGKWLLVVVGLLPMMIHMAGSMSADVMNNLILLAFIAFILNLFTQKNVISKKQLVILVGLSGLVAVTKMTNLVLLLPILFLPHKILPQLAVGSKQIPRAVVRFIIGVACGVAAILVLATWIYLYGDTVATNVNVENPVAEKPYLFLKILFNTYINSDNLVGGVSYADWLFRGVAGSFASFNYHLPYGVVMLLTGLFVLVGLRKDVREEALLKNSLNRLSISVLLALALVVCAMTYGLYVAWAIRTAAGPDIDFALGLQGRYFTPLLLLLLPLCVYIRKYVYVHVKDGILLGATVFSIATFSLLFYIIQTLSFVSAL